MKNKEMLILLVDDDEDILEFISYNLRSEGYKVVTAQNGVEAIKKAKKHLPHLIILDVMMPEMDGIEACEKMRTLPELSKTLITFLTARGEDYSQLAGFDAGADDYITKPIKPKVLAGRVKALLRRVKSDLENRLVFDGLIIDRDEYKITVQNKEIDMPRREFELLTLLASQDRKSVV